jgi:hypothetical protein
MTESVLGGEALMEAYDNGSLYVTVRFALMDNITDIKLSVQKDADSEYIPVNYMTVKEYTGEGADAKADLRFELPGPDAIARAEFFVTPMGRDVIFFMNFTDPVPGSGDFTVSPPPTEVAHEPPEVSAAPDEVNSDAVELAETETPMSGGMTDTKFFIAIAAVIAEALVIFVLLLTRRKPKGDLT